MLISYKPLEIFYCVFHITCFNGIKFEFSFAGLKCLEEELQSSKKSEMREVCVYYF